MHCTLNALLNSLRYKHSFIPPSVPIINERNARDGPMRAEIGRCALMRWNDFNFWSCWLCTYSFLFIIKWLLHLFIYVFYYCWMFASVNWLLKPKLQPRIKSVYETWNIMPHYNKIYRGNVWNLLSCLHGSSRFFNGFFSLSIWKHPDTVSAVLTEEKKVASPLRQECILSLKWDTISCMSGQSLTCFNCE